MRVCEKYDTTVVGTLSTRNRTNKSYTTEISATYNTTFGSNHSIEVIELPINKHGTGAWEAAPVQYIH
jgi:hypothetical protein